MVARRSFDLLPTVFQTESNRKFLNATVDQLIQEPAMTRLSNFIGRAEGSSVYNKGDSYIKEGSGPINQYYQLEPSSVIRKRKTGVKNEYNVDNVYNYVDLLNSIASQGGLNNNHDRLFNQEYYNFQGFVDIEKLINYNQYYWVPNGPDALDVNAGGLAVENTFTVSRPWERPLNQDNLTNTVVGLPSYTFSGFGTDANPTITLVRGGVYKFAVDQVGYPFYIQTTPGLSGISPIQNNISIREIKGVTNNGTDNGVVTFAVPKNTAQDEFINMQTYDTVDWVLDVPFNQIQNVPVDLFLQNNTFDGVKTLDTVKKVIFTDQNDDNWFEAGNFDLDSAPFDTAAFDQGQHIPVEYRKGIWELKIEQVPGTLTTTSIIKCTYLGPWPGLTKVFVKQGNKYGNTFVYKDATDTITSVPNITAILDTLYYQDGVDPDIFGTIKLVDPDPASILNLNDIIGKKNYTSPNGVKFTNGLKVKFTQLVEPESYKDKEYIVEGVGKAISLHLWTDFATPEQYTVDQGNGFDANGENFDMLNFDNTFNAPIDKEYITISRSSTDGNAWSRGNRWFHKDVLNYTASIRTPNQSYPFNENNRAKRPVVEFIPNLKLYNYGSNFLSVVNLLDNTITDAFSLVEGTTTFFVDGVELNNNQLVAFINDSDPMVRSKIYRVTKNDVDGLGTIKIHLEHYADAQNGSVIVVNSGKTKQGNAYYWSAITNSWSLAQEKTYLNQEPLFDVVDANGYSFGDKVKYSSSNFIGSKLFSYKKNTTATAVDSELGFALTYRTLGNIGVIVFENNFDADTFSYNYNNTNNVVQINTGNALQFVNGSYVKINPWVKVQEKSKQFIEKKFTATFSKNNDFDLKVIFKNSTVQKNIFVFVNNNIVNNYTLLSNGTNSILRFDNNLTIDDSVLVRIYGASVDNNSNTLYTVPLNLERNGLNETFDSLTLGQIRDHLITITKNSLEFSGDPIGNNNLRDINYQGVGGNILQHSATIPYAQLMFNNNSTNVIEAINFSRREYSRFKNQFLDILEKNQFKDTSNARQTLDEVMHIITAQANNSQPFYYTDMMPFNKNYIKTSYEVFNFRDRNYNAINSYDYANGTSFYQSILVYVNNIQLIKNKDYTVSGRLVTIHDNFNLATGDVIDLYEYQNTFGCMIPATPSKLGIFPAYEPEIYTDTTIFDQNIESKKVIQGHDGSITLAFNDFRDNVLLEFEKRIFNNIKVDYNNSLPNYEIYEPNAFKQSEYNINEWTQLLSSTFLEWAGSNNIDYYSNVTLSNDLFSFNYSEATDKLYNQLLPGYWRAIYKYFYNTDRPHTHPWEIVGYSIKPTWWENTYGPAPYSSGNLVLWQDLENGVYYENGVRYINPNYIRPGLTQIIPVDDHGNLLPPTACVIREYNNITANKKWRFGDQGPQETAWRRSSDYPYAVMIAYALAKPAEFCWYTFNTRDYVKTHNANNDGLNQIYNKKYNNRKFSSEITDATQNIPGTNVFIRDRLVSLGLDLNQNFVWLFDDLAVNLSYKMSGYTDKKYLQVLAEQSSPQSKNVGILIPSEDINIVLTKSAPISKVTYSAIIVEKTSVGWSVSGFDIVKPYFTVIPSIMNSNNYALRVGSETGIIYQDADDKTLSIPYGTVFTSKQQVVDFLISYGRWLTTNGFIFDQLLSDQTTRADWTLAVKEFLYFVQQDWGDNTVISLTPAATTLKFDNRFGVVDNLTNSYNQTRIVSSDNRTLMPKEYRIYRDGTAFEINIKDQAKGIHLLDIESVQYEHTLVFNNKTVFNDVIYDEVLGSRQQRLKLVGRKTQDWNGSLFAPGFLINHKPVDSWLPKTDYYKGDIVSFKNKYYTCINFLPGKEKFNQSDWYEIKNNLLEQKLIPNPAYNAAQFTSFYDVDTEDINTTADLQTRHSTGWQPRDYFVDIGLNSISQHKFYLGMISEKGTKSSIDNFLRAKIPYTENNINIQEEWALKLGNYGAVNNRDSLEFSLDKIKSSNNQIIVELLNYNDVRSSQWNTFKPFDLLSIPNNYDKDLFGADKKVKPSYATAGYADINSSLVSVFNINKISNINGLANIMGEGTRIWIGSDVNNDWNMYRASNNQGQTIVSVNQISANELEFVTSNPHDLNINDKILIKNARVNTITVNGQTPADISGIYRVNRLVNLTTFRVDVTNQNLSISANALNSLFFKLESIRFADRLKFADFRPYKGWQEGDLAFIDNVDNKWQVLQNKMPWKYIESLSPDTVTSTSNFGQNIALNPAENAMAVSSEELNGRIHYYVRDEFNFWNEVESIAATHENTVNFGQSISLLDNKLFVGAPESFTNGLVYVYDLGYDGSAVSQIIYDPTLISADPQFGFSVVASRDARWLYISAPGEEEVYAYRLRVVDNKETITHISDGSTAAYNMPSGIGTGGLAADQIKVYQNGKLLIPYIDYTMNYLSTQVVMTVLPAVDDTITIVYDNYYQYTGTISNPGIANNFGHKLATTSNGQDLFISAYTNNNTKDSNVYDSMGVVYAVKRTVEKFIADGQSKSFTTFYFGENPSISVDGVYLNEDTEWTRVSNYEYQLNNIPNASAIVSVETNNFNVVETLSAPDYQNNLNYGYDLIVCPNNCSIYVSAPNYRNTTNTTGAVYRHVNVPRLYGTITGNKTNPAVTPGNIIRINDFQVAITGSDLDQTINDINNAGIPGVTAINADNKIKIVSNSQLTFNKLSLSNDYGNTLEELGLTIYPYVQSIDSVYQQDGLRFGERLAISPDATSLLISSTKANGITNITFDSAATTFDSNTTAFNDVVVRSGSTYLYEYQRSATETETDIGKFAYANKLVKDNLKSLDAYGSAIALGTNWLFVTAPKGDFNDQIDKGTVSIFRNSTGNKTWTVYKTTSDSVDSNKISRAFIYNKKLNEIEAELPVVDSLYGKHLPNVIENINYTTNYDPAVYSNVPSTVSFIYDPKNSWGKKQVGTLWWDTNSIKYIDWNQGDLQNRSKLRDALFPSSTIDLYQWVESDVSPSQYNTDNAAMGLRTLYTKNEVFSQHLESVDSQSKLKYYFWVKINTTNVSEVTAGNLNTQQLINSLINPKSSGLPFISLIGTNAFALYNCQDFIGGDHVLKIEYNKSSEIMPIHNEWSLFPDKSIKTIPDETYNKLVDSVAAQDINGRVVPDSNLKENQRYGLVTNPRQTIFKNVNEAKKLFVDYANSVFIKYPIRLIRNIDALLDQEPYPNPLNYDEAVENSVELSYLSTDLYVDKTVLVKNDDLTGGWTLRKLISKTIDNRVIKEWIVLKSQVYNNSLYWTYTDWYAEGYSANFVPTYYVDFSYEISNLKLRNNDTILIKNSSSGGWQLVKINNNNLELIGQAAATVQFNSSLYSSVSAGFGIDTRSFETAGFSTDNAIELRKLFVAVSDILNQNAGVFVNEFRSYYKQLINLYIELVNSQFVETDWLFKTSFISIDHNIRALEQIPVYTKAPEQMVESYINETKPYHAKIRQYTSLYDGKDTASVSLSDFDLPSYYDPIANRYRSPQLENLTEEYKFSETPYIDWYNNYEYQVESIEIINGGVNYTNDTKLIIEGNAKARVKVRANGEIYAVIIDDPGDGYKTPPSIFIEGIGTGAVLIAKLANKKVRTVNTTIKFDRYTRSAAIGNFAKNTVYLVDDTFIYDNTPYRVIEGFYSAETPDFLKIVPLIVRPWQPNTGYSAYDIIEVDWQNRIYYEVLNDFTTTNLFETSNLTPYNGAVLDNAVDRTYSYYNPTAGMPGKDLPQLIKGLEYPGVNVLGLNFNQEPGFDVARFDIELFDASNSSPDGIDAAVGSTKIDNVISSQFTDLNLGLRPEDIITDGAGFVDVYNSHAPEELVPGRIFDSLDIKVTTSPLDGQFGINTPDIKITSYMGDNATTEFAFSNQILGGVEKIIVYTKDQGFLHENIDFTIDWVANKVITSSAVNANDIIYIMVIGATGEGSLADLSFYGDGSTTAFKIDDLSPTSPVGQFYVKINGQETTAFTYNNLTCEVVFNSAPAANDYIQVHVFTVDSIRKAYSSIKEVNYTVSGGNPGDLVAYPDGYLFTLPELMQYIAPWNSFISVKINNEELTPANNVYYIGDGSSTHYMIPSTKLSNDATISDTDIVVTVNKVLQQQNINYTILRDGSSLPVVQFNTAPADNDNIVISDTSVADYNVIDNQTLLIKNRLNINNAAPTDLKVGDKVTITQFSNHDMYDMRTEVFVGLLTTTYSYAGFDSLGFDAVGFDAEIGPANTVSSPKYTLSRAISNYNYIQVYRNGGLLLPNIDYILYNDIILEIAPELGILDTDIIHVRTYGTNAKKPVVRLRIFKDMLDQTSYLGISYYSETELTADLNLTDQTIYVKDASTLSEPGITANQPGVVFINGERITYWAKDNATNTLTRIRRSTGGTGAKKHLAGSIVQDASKNMTIPDGDKIWYNIVDGGQSGPFGPVLLTDGQNLQNSNTTASRYLLEISK